MCLSHVNNKSITSQAVALVLKQKWTIAHILNHTFREPSGKLPGTFRDLHHKFWCRNGGGQGPPKQDMWLVQSQTIFPYLEIYLKRVYLPGYLPETFRNLPERVQNTRVQYTFRVTFRKPSGTFRNCSVLTNHSVHEYTLPGNLLETFRDLPELQWNKKCQITLLLWGLWLGQIIESYTIHNEEQWGFWAAFIYIYIYI